MGSAAYYDFYGDESGAVNGEKHRQRRRRWRRLGALESIARSRYLMQTNGSYDTETNAGVDVFFSTVALPAFYSALPSTVGLLDDDFEVLDEVRSCNTSINTSSTGLGYPVHWKGAREGRGQRGREGCIWGFPW